MTLNDLRPVALSSQVMKAMERLVKQHILTLINSQLDPLQFAYQSRKGVDDAKGISSSTPSTDTWSFPTPLPGPVCRPLLLL